MALNLKVKKRVLNFTKEKKEVYVATPDRGNTIDAEKIAELIAQDTGARPAQVKMILDTLIDSMMTWLEEGHGVQLGSFGSFMPSVKSKSSDDPGEVEVRRTRLVFYPSKELVARVGAIEIPLNAGKSYLCNTHRVSLKGYIIVNHQFICSHLSISFIRSFNKRKPSINTESLLHCIESTDLMPSNNIESTVYSLRVSSINRLIARP